MLPFLPLVLLAAPPACAVQARLNPYFPRVDQAGSVRDFLLHPAGTEVLFRVDARHAGALELYHAPLDGSRRPLPVVSMAPGRSVAEYAFTEDGRWLVFSGEREQEGALGLYKHLVGTPGSVRFDAGDFHAVEEGADFVLAGNRVVFTIRGEDYGLVVADLASAAPPRFLFDGPVVLLGASGTAGRAYFTTAGALLSGLFSVPLAGGAEVLLAEGNVHGVELDPAEQRLLYLLQEGSARSLRSVPIDGSGPAFVLASGLPTYADFRQTPDGARVVFEGGPSSAPQIFARASDASSSAVLLSDPTRRAALAGVHGERAYFVESDLDGTSSQLVSRALDGDGAARFLAEDLFASDLAVSPDGHWLVFRGWTTLYSVPADGSASPVLLADQVVGFELSPASDRVLAATYTGLRSLPIDGSGPGVTLPGRPGPFAFTPDGAHVLVVSPVAGPPELYRVGALDLARVKLSRELARGTTADVEDFATIATPSSVAFRAGEPGADVLYAAPADGSAPALALTGTGVGAWVATPDGARITYLRNSERQLWVVMSDGSAAPLRLPVTLPAGDTIADLAVTADGARVAFLVGSVPSTGAPPRRELRIAPLDGTPGMTLAADVTRFALAPDARAALFYEYLNGTYHFRRVALDGSESPLTLASYSAGSFFPVLAFTPDASRALVWIHSSNSHVFSAALQGPADVRQLRTDSFMLGSLLVATDEVVLVPARSSAVGAAFELWSLAVDGGRAPLQLSAGGADVRGVWLAPGGSEVVYKTTVVSPQREQLFKVRLDGSTAPVALGPAMDPIGDARFTPDGTRLVFRAGPGYRFPEVFVVPLDASAPPRRVSRVAVYAGAYTAGNFALTPDASAVLFAADPDGSGALELWQAPLDGSTAAFRLGPPLAAPGVLALALSPDGRALVYRAAAEPGVNELFSLPLPADARTRRRAPR